MKKATHQDTKKHNTRLVLKTIYDQVQISRVDIAEHTFLTRPTVSDIVAELAEAELIEEVGIGPSVGGKPPILLSVAENARCLLSLDLANSEFRGALINLRGRVLHRISLPVHDRDGDAALGLVTQLVDTLVAAADCPILGIGIGTPGLVDASSGIVRNAVNLDWRDLPLKELLEERYELPCHVSNDSQVAALAEITFGSGKAAENLALIKLGRGVGAGIVIGRALYHGDGFGAGEIGHVVVTDDGDLCNCGRHGCLETLISSRALVKQARAAAKSNPRSELNRLASSPEDIAMETILNACESGDEAARATIHYSAQHLGQVLATLVAALNIHHVVLAGSLARFGGSLTEPVQKEINRRILPAVAAETTVEVSDLGADIVLLGCAALVLSLELGIT
jgi:glucokinase-like ROK family protein